MTLSTDAAKKVFAQCLADHQDELATLYKIPACFFSDLKNWKRVSKEKQSGSVSRKFVFRDNCLLIAYVFSDLADEHFTSISIGVWSGASWTGQRTFFLPGGEEMEKAAKRKKEEEWEACQKRKEEETKAIMSATPTDVLTKLQQNPVTVQLKAEGENVSPKLTGRIIFLLPIGAQNPDDWDRQCAEEGDDNYGLFAFECGPEYLEPGCLADNDTCDRGLAELFADFGNKIDIGASENQHVVLPIPGVKASELWQVIRTRLERSGAKLVSC